MRPSAWLFDLDGVLVANDRLNARCWKRAFDELLERRPGQEPFDPIADYRLHVDGRPSRDGILAFAQARGLKLTDADVGRVDERRAELVAAAGVVPVATGLAFLRHVHEDGAATAVVSSSEDAGAAIASVGAAELVDVVVDGRLDLPPKPAPDAVLAAAARLRIAPPRAACLDDGLAGVEAAARAGIGLVVALARDGFEAELAAAGADVVVADAAELGARLAAA